MKCLSFLFLALLGCTANVRGETYLIQPDGSGDHPTIQAAVHAASNGDVIMLASGVFTGNGNRDIEVIDKDVTIVSESGDPTQVIIDCQGSPGEEHWAFYFGGRDQVVDGISMINGNVTSPGGFPGGGAVNTWSGSATFLNCVFTGNTAPRGGAIVAGYCELNIVSCTFHDNAATQTCGSALVTEGNTHALLSNCIVAFGVGGSAFCSYGGDVELVCCDIYGNEGGNYVGPVSGQLGVNGNISEDPLFCGTPGPEFDLRVHKDSPCVPFSPPNGDCDLIGARPIGCGLDAIACCVAQQCQLATEEECISLGGDWMIDPLHLTCEPNPCLTPIQRTTWGEVKGLYRDWQSNGRDR
ncbi:hypothetical protein ACFL6M_07380 [Candidatus Eisenbacteria bacterium]|uniref:Right handed beta helix domain-containing protein n=1 Tax=Eiseniibacteriota bacterium TaxID=2212470 RepID=A0ABV6YM41_UNCEI